MMNVNLNDDIAIVIAALAFLLAVSAVPFAVIALRASAELKREKLAPPIDWPRTWAEIVAANGGVPPKPRTREQREREARAARNYRHNIHCPKCGRFARKPAGFDVIVCMPCDLLTLSNPTGPIAVTVVRARLHELPPEEMPELVPELPRELVAL